MKDFGEEMSKVKDEIYKFFNGDNFYNYLKKSCDKYFLKNYYNLFKTYCLGGKCARAYLTYLGYYITTQKDFKESIKDILYPALSYEIFETAVLAHDDIIDKSPTRRGIPAMYVALGNNHLAMSKTLCMGDLGLYLALDILHNSNFKKNIINKMLKHQTNIFITTVIGELKDVDMSNSKSYTVNDVMTMYYLKTANYSTIGPLTLGAIAGGAKSKDIKLLKEIAKNLGICYQIKDDILGIFSNTETLGKSITTDIVEGKKTLLTAIFNKLATTEQKKSFYNLYGNKSSFSQEELNYLKDVLIKTNTLTETEKVLNEYVLKAKQLILKTKYSENSKKLLLDFADYVSNRNK